MAPTYPWVKSKPKQTTQLNNTSFPSLKVPEERKSAPESEYKQVQEDELFVLKAIYGDDYESEDTKPGAWKVSYGPRYVSQDYVLTLITEIRTII
jgi:hypothetical protein